ncbi:MAG: FAD-dependent oxidoreductase, partial [Acidimicrobiales bacterium]|nr:FAD-dependent oxidoreductase [Acidimicrobiales bacterium]
MVVGAGLAGLAAARELRRRNRDVVVLEASDGVGGRVRTDDVDGFQLDRGFQILLTGYPEAARQLDLAGLDLRCFEPGALVLLDGKRLRMGDPLRAPSSLPATALSPVGSIADKLRVLKLRTTVGRGDPRPLFGGADVSTAEHLRSLGFSDGFVRRFLGPLFAGIQLDPELRTSRKMFDLIFRSLATGDAAVPARGMRAIPEQLAAGLPAGTVHLGRRVLAVDGDSVTVEGGATVTARAVLVATEGPAAATLTGIPEPGSRSAGCVWFDAPRSPFDRRLIGLDGTNAGPVRNLAVMSDIAPEYAPPGRALVAAACPADVAEDLEPRV